MNKVEPPARVENVADFVDLHIGVVDKRRVKEHSNCVIGPQVPHGSVNPSPDTPNGGNDGYHPDEPIRGFSQLHVSGTGWGQYGQVLLSPQVGLSVDEEGHDSEKADEEAKCYRYGVTLTRYGIRAEFTPAHHSVLYRFAFPASDESHIVLDLTHHLTEHIYKRINGKFKGGELEFSNNGRTVQGRGRYVGGFGPRIDYDVFFYAEFSKEPAAFGTFKNGKPSEGESAVSGEPEKDHIGGFVRYGTRDGEEVLVRIGISFKSIAKAREWLEGEIPTFDFQPLVEQNRQSWDEALSPILIEGASDSESRIFYSAMYRTLCMPRDRTDDFSHVPEEDELWDDHYSMWDTWRTVFSFLLLIRPEAVRANLASFIARYRRNGAVCTDFITGREKFHDQGGNDVDNVVTDAFVKGLEGVDWKAAYDLVKNHAEHARLWPFFKETEGDSNLTEDVYRRMGWIPAGRLSCSHTLGFSYNDFCAAQMAMKLGDPQDHAAWLDRSRKWTELWNADAESEGYKGFIAARKKDGTWIEDFDPAFEPPTWSWFFYEGSSWTYSYVIPHDAGKLIELSGGKESFVQKLEYALGHGHIGFNNEPSFMAIRLLAYAGLPDACSYWARKILAERFDEEGYPGNDDSGAMGSWYIFTALGLFPNAGQDIYILNAPVFGKATLQLENGKDVVVVNRNPAPENVYVRSCTFNGQPWNKAWCRHRDLADGAVIEYETAAQPSDWGKMEPPPSGVSREYLDGL